MRAGLVALILAASPAAGQSLEHLGTFVWDRPEDYFGGWSGLEVSDEGGTITAIGDNAQFYQGPVTRSGGRILDIPRRPVGALTDTDGVAFFRKSLADISDSEGLTLLSGARYAVSFEREPRIMIYGGSAPTRVELPRESLGLSRNSGVEALAADRDGRLIAIPESIPPGATGFPVWRQTDPGWEQIAELKRTQGFRPVGADLGPDGQLYILERAFRGIGFQSRVRRLNLDTDPPTIQTLWSASMAQYDNLEGLSVWQDGSGDIRLTMISDDNYNWFQRTEIVEFRLTD